MDGLVAAVYCCATTYVPHDPLSGVPVAADIVMIPPAGGTPAALCPSVPHETTELARSTSPLEDSCTTQSEADGVRVDSVGMVFLERTQGQVVVCTRAWRADSLYLSL